MPDGRRRTDRVARELRAAARCIKEQSGMEFRRPGREFKLESAAEFYYLLRLNAVNA